jgi:glycolate oxidase FAD binding subunit
MSQDLTAHLQQQILSAIDKNSPLQIQGGGSKHFLGHINPATRLNVDGHRGIISYDPVELVITARAGTRLSELEKLLDDNGQMLPFEPPHFGDTATIGGTIACGLAGPSRAFAGSARDYVLGVKLINGKGEILHFGGQVMKNVAGYDCSRLMAGAMGTLGVILEVSLKVLPKAAAEMTLIQTCHSDEAIHRMAKWSGKSLPLSAACYADGKLAFRLSGAATAVNSARDTIGGDIHENGSEFWQSIKEHTHHFFKTEKPLWRLSVAAATPAIPLEGEWLIDWCGAQRWLSTDTSADDIRRACETAGGHATLFRRAQLNEQTFHPPEHGVMQLHQRLKAAFDPKHLFNPGRLYAEL